MNFPPEIVNVSVSSWVEGPPTPLAAGTVGGDDLVVALDLRAPELRGEGALGELEQLAVVGKDADDALALARHRALGNSPTMSLTALDGGWGARRSGCS